MTESNFLTPSNDRAYENLPFLVFLLQEQGWGKKKMYCGFYTALTGLVATFDALDLFANNFANVNTTGYKAHVSSLLYRRKRHERPATEPGKYCEQYLLRDHPSLFSALKLPSQITLERFHRAITRQEVAKAIHRALGDQGIAGKDSLDLNDLQFSTPIYVTQSDPGLEVLRIESDPLRRETRFRLWTSKEPGNLPFTVAVPRAVKLPTLVARHTLTAGEIVSATDFAVEMRPGVRSRSSPATAASDLAGLETRAPIRAGQTVNHNQFAQPVLVEPGTLATLILQSASFSIKTIVIPLEQGMFGQEIRVRNAESRQVVEAKVVGRDRLLKAWQREDNMNSSRDGHPVCPPHEHRLNLTTSPTIVFC